MPEENNRTRKKPDKIKISPVEWIAAGIGAALYIFSFSYILYSAVVYEAIPPSLTIRENEIISAEPGYLVKITAVNNGTMTAEGVIIEGMLIEGTSVVERSETTLDYVPGRSEISGGMFFKNDPHKYRLSLRALGYEEP